MAFLTATITVAPVIGIINIVPTHSGSDDGLHLSTLTNPQAAQLTDPELGELLD